MSVNVPPMSMAATIRLLDVVDEADLAICELWADLLKREK